MKVLYFTSNIDAAGCYRCLFPGRELRRQHGWVCGMPPYRLHRRSDRSLLVEFVGSLGVIEGVRPDVVVLQQPLDREYEQIIDTAKAVGSRVVVENDDYHLAIPAWNPAFTGTDPKLSPNRNRDHLHRFMRMADLVTVSTNFLATAYSAVHVPNLLDWEMWDRVVPRFERSFRRVRVGWMGDSRWRRGDLDVLRGLIGPWLRRNPHVEFVAAGDCSVHDYLDVPAGQRVSTVGVDFHNMDLADITATMDVGLVPLAENRFNEAKSALKGMEYAACGIPCVASPTESYRGWCGGGDVGRLARRPKDWLRHLSELVEDHSLRRGLGFNAWEQAKQHTIQGRVGEWETVFTNLVQG